MPQLWKSALPGRDLAHSELVRLIELTEAELPFAAIVANMALEAASLGELENHLVSIYRIALDVGHPTVPDHADRILIWIERLQDSANLPV